MLSFTQDEKVLILKLLLRAAKADHRIAQEETAYITQIMDQLGIPKSELNQLQEEAEDVEIPDGEKKRMTILYYLLFLLRVDRKIGQREEQLAIDVGFELGFNEVLVRNLVNELRDYVSGEVPDEALLRHIRAQLN